MFRTRMVLSDISFLEHIFIKKKLDADYAVTGDSEKTITMKLSVIIFEGDGKTTSIPRRTLEFEASRTVESIVHEICSYEEFGSVKPLFLKCLEDGVLLSEDFTLESAKIDSSVRLLKLTSSTSIN